LSWEVDKESRRPVRLTARDDQSVSTILNPDDPFGICAFAEVVESLLNDTGNAGEDLEFLAVLFVSWPILRLARLAAVVMYVSIRFADAASAGGRIATDDALWLWLGRHGFEVRRNGSQEMLQRVGEAVDGNSEDKFCDGNASLGGAGQCLIRSCLTI
jgi:hypothetical protein